MRYFLDISQLFSIYCFPQVVQVSCSEEESFAMTEISGDEIQVLDHDQESGDHQVRIGGEPVENNQERIEEEIIQGGDREPGEENVNTGDHEY